MNIFNYPPTIIFSVSQGQDKSLDKLNTDMVEGALTNEMHIPVKRVLGCYDGIEQESFIINAKYKQTVLEIMHDYKQDVALYVDNDQPHTAFIMDKTGTMKEIGEYKRVNEEQAKKSRAWTRDITGQYWSTF